jgi:putative membrane protein
MTFGAKTSSALLMAALLVTGGAVPTVAVGQDTTTRESTAASSDRDFVMTAAHDGMMEVELGRLALERASSPEVKQFAQRMIDDHSKANADLSTLASSKGLTVPAQMDAKQQAHLDKMKGDLTKVSGMDFDHQYMKMMEKDHEKAVRLFEKQSTNGKDADLKSFASTTLPTLQSHLQTARDWNAKMKNSPKPND